MLRKNRPHRKEQRRKEAQERQARYDALTFEQKLDRAVKRGGSAKEIKRLRNDSDR